MTTVKTICLAAAVTILAGLPYVGAHAANGFGDEEATVSQYSQHPGFGDPETLMADPSSLNNIAPAAGEEQDDGGSEEIVENDAGISENNKAADDAAAMP